MEKYSVIALVTLWGLCLFGMEQEERHPQAYRKHVPIHEELPQTRPSWVGVEIEDTPQEAARTGKTTKYSGHIKSKHAAAKKVDSAQGTAMRRSRLPRYRYKPYDSSGSSSTSSPVSSPGARRKLNFEEEAQSEDLAKALSSIHFERSTYTGKPVYKEKPIYEYE